MSCPSICRSLCNHHRHMIDIRPNLHFEHWCALRHFPLWGNKINIKSSTVIKKFKKFVTDSDQWNLILVSFFLWFAMLHEFNCATTTSCVLSKIYVVVFVLCRQQMNLSENHSTNIDALLPTLDNLTDLLGTSVEMELQDIASEYRFEQTDYFRGLPNISSNDVMHNITVKSNVNGWLQQLWWNK